MAEPTSRQRRLLVGLFAFAALVFVVGIVAISVLAGAV